MSFDLSIFARQGGIDARGFEAMFATRARYTVGDGQVVYENPDTGVYFLFDHIMPDGDDDPEALANEPRLAEAHIGFTLNYFRPDIFGIEAAIELTTLLGGGELEIFDPQAGESENRFDPDAFLERWRRGNRASTPIMREQGLPREPSQPIATSEAVWRWNYRRAEVQAGVGEEVFVPMIMYFSPSDGKVRRTFVWSLSIPTVVPDAADSVLLRDDLAPAGFFGRLSGKSGEPKVLGIVPRAAVEGLLQPLAGHPGLSWLPEGPPRDWVAQVGRNARNPGQRLATEQVFDAEV